MAKIHYADIESAPQQKKLSEPIMMSDFLKYGPKYQRPLSQATAGLFSEDHISFAPATNYVKSYLTYCAKAVAVVLKNSRLQAFIKHCKVGQIFFPIKGG